MAIIPEHKKNKFKKEFIGRIQYIEKFDSTLINPKDHNVVFFHGIGGIGKTSLLKELFKKTKNNQHYICVFIDLENGGTPAEFYSYIKYNLLLKNKIKTPYFDLAYLIYWQKKNPHLELKKDNIPFLEEGGTLADAISLLEGFATGLPVLSGLIQVCNKYKTNLSLKLKKLMSFNTVHGENIYSEFSEINDKEASDIELILNQFLEYDLLEYFQNNPEKKFLFFIDTYEILFEKSNKNKKLSHDKWLRELVKTLPGQFFIMAGRDKLIWEDETSQWGDYINHLELTGLSNEEAKQLLLKSGIYNEDIIYEIIKNSLQIPFYLEQSVELYRTVNNPSVETFKNLDSGIILERLLQYSDPSETLLLKYLSVSNYFDEEIFDNLIKKFGIGKQDFKFIVSKNFIKQSDDRFFIHKLMKNTLYGQLDDSIKTNIHEYFFNYNKTNLEKSLSNPSLLSQTYFMEAIFHTLQINNKDIIWIKQQSKVFKQINFKDYLLEPLNLTLNLVHKSLKNDVLFEIAMYYIESSLYENAKDIIFFEISLESLSNNQKAYYYYIEGLCEKNTDAKKRILYKALNLAEDSELKLLIDLEYLEDLTKKYKKDNIQKLLKEYSKDESIPNHLHGILYYKASQISINFASKLKLLNESVKYLDSCEYYYIEKANVYTEIATQFEDTNPIEAFDFSLKALKMYRILKITDKTIIGKTYKFIAKQLIKENKEYSINEFPEDVDVDLLFLFLFSQKYNIDHNYLEYIKQHTKKEFLPQLYYDVGLLYYKNRNNDLAINFFKKVVELGYSSYFIEALVELIVCSPDETDEYEKMLVNTITKEQVVSYYKKIVAKANIGHNQTISKYYLNKSFEICQNNYKENTSNYKQLLDCFKDYLNFFEQFNNKEEYVEYIEKYINLAKLHNDMSRIKSGYFMYVEFCIKVKDYMRIIHIESQIESFEDNKHFSIVKENIFTELIVYYEDLENDFEKAEEYYGKQIQEREKGVETYRLCQTYNFFAKFLLEKRNDSQGFIVYILKVIELLQKENNQYEEILLYYRRLIRGLKNEHCEQYCRDVIALIEKNCLEYIYLQDYLKFLNMLLMQLPDCDETNLVIEKLESLDIKKIKESITSNELFSIAGIFTRNSKFNYKVRLQYFQIQYEIVTRKYQNSKNVQDDYRELIQVLAEYSYLLYDNNEIEQSKILMEELKEFILYGKNNKLSNENLERGFGYVNSYYVYRINDFDQVLQSSFLEQEVYHLIRKNKDNQYIGLISTWFDYFQKNYFIKNDYKNARKYYFKKAKLFNNDTEKLLKGLSSFYSSVIENTQQISVKIDYTLKRLKVTKQSKCYISEESYKKSLVTNYSNLRKYYEEIGNYEFSKKYLVKLWKLYRNQRKSNLKSILNFYEKCLEKSDIERHLYSKYLDRVIKIKELNIFCQFLQEEKIELYSKILVSSIDKNPVLVIKYLQKIFIEFDSTDETTIFLEFFNRLVQTGPQLINSIKSAINNIISNRQKNDFEIEAFLPILFNIYLKSNSKKQLLNIINKKFEENLEQYLNQTIQFCKDNQYTNEVQFFYFQLFKVQEKYLQENELVKFYKNIIYFFTNEYFNVAYRKIYVSKLMMLDPAELISIINIENNKIIGKIDDFINHNEAKNEYVQFLNEIKHHLQNNIY